MPRGRPKGSKNKEGPKFLHYNPQKWEPWHEALVMRSVAGESNKDLAEKFGITPTHVSNILCCPQANVLRETIREKILAHTDTLSEKMAKIQELAADRVIEFLERRELAQNAPHATVDRALGALRLTTPQDISKKDSEKQDSTTNIQQNIFIAQPELLQRIQEGLDKSNKIQANPLKMISNG